MSRRFLSRRPARDVPRESQKNRAAPTHTRRQGMSRNYGSRSSGYDSAGGSHDDTSRTPGKRTRTEMLPVLRKRAGAGGVAHDAAEKVGAAGSSSGAPLPADVRSRFESSLGADLGG